MAALEGGHPEKHKGISSRLDGRVKPGQDIGAKIRQWFHGPLLLAETWG
jgi:hypothetical protein